MKSQRIQVGVFAKFPEAGRVKTRLAPLLGHTDCALLAEYLLLSTLDRLCSSAEFVRQAELLLWTDGGDQEAWDKLLARSEFDHSNIARKQQIDGHLGQRMQAAVSAQLGDSDCAVLIGPDAIALQAEDILDLVKATESTGIGFIPADDGGYVAMACRQLYPTVFSEHIAWGTATVAKTTQERLKFDGVNAIWLAKQPDLDEPEDYRRALQMGLIPHNWQEMYAG